MADRTFWTGIVVGWAGGHAADARDRGHRVATGRALGVRELYGVVALLVAACGLLRLALGAHVDPGASFLLFTPAVAVSAWLGGFTPGLVATAGGALLGLDLVTGDVGAADPAAFDDTAFVTFVAIGLMFSWFGQHLRRRSAQLAASEEQLSTLVSGAAVGLAHLDPQGRIVFANEGFATLVQRGREELLDLRFQDLSGPDDRADVATLLERLSEHGRVHDALVQLRAPDGHPVWLEVNASRCRAHRSGADTRVVVAADGTDRRRHEALAHATEHGLAEAARERERLLVVERAARAESERAGRLKDDFLNLVSHELRTPLNAMMGWIQVLRQTPMPPEVRQPLEIVERNAVAHGRLIEDLLELSALLSGRLTLTLEPVDVVDVVGAALQRHRREADARRVALDVALERVPRVLGDGPRLVQVVDHLLDNALKFTPAGGRVAVSLSQRGDEVRLAVDDTGQGISPEFLPHAFDHFRREDVSLRRVQQPGIGIGLSLVKQVVERHGGRVDAASRGVGRGARFVVSLPIPKAATPEEPAGRDMPAGALVPLRQPPRR